jgi:hypothetical protein
MTAAERKLKQKKKTKKKKSATFESFQPLKVALQRLSKPQKRFGIENNFNIQSQSLNTALPRRLWSKKKSYS